ncbi:AIPR family protein [Aeromonas hydrophila]|nr:AIPR family protein [Aeromonas hydrophila]
MKDEILRSFLTSFSEQNGYSELGEDEQFEKFANFNVISKLYPRDINIDDLSTGGQDDIGIDGAAIIINGAIVQSEEEIDFLLSRNGTLDVTFAFIQSKNSAKFKGDQIGTFIFGIKSLFDDKAAMPENEYISQIRTLKEKVYQHSIDFETPPQLKLYFVTTGEWKEPAPIVGRVERELQSLDEKKLFENKAEIEFYDAERLKSTFRELIRKSVKEITFNNHVALPDMPEALNVRQSFIGSIQVNSYLDLITNDEGNLSKGLFYDNVRDYQGSNKVNREIHETLNSKLWQNLLPLLNNGITIISKKVDKVGSKLKLSDFQIVNGCQSSHVLFENKAVVGDNTHIVIKVIETNDQDVINKIIRATNRQTEVKDEAFESLKPFHKDLEEFYKAKSNSIPYPIYYERRSKEYLGDPKVKPVQVITLASQIKSYVSLVLEQPQSTHRYFGELLESNESRLFSNTKNLSEYYLSALIVNRLEALFRGRSRGGIFNYKAFKYHISFLTYILIKKEFGEDKDKLISLSSDKGRLKPFFDKSIDLITKALRETSLNKRDAIRNREFAVRIKEKALSL